jgi:glycosyltransferase involved in cell wall biosynthesis
MSCPDPDRYAHAISPSASPPAALVLPAFDEAAALSWLVARADDYLTATRSAHTLIVVDDGSRDGTTCVLAALASARANLIVVRHDGSRGYGAALRTGFAVALSTGHQWIAWCDANGRYDPIDVDLLVGGARAHGVELAIGYRRRAEAWTRRAVGRIGRSIHGPDVRDVHCGFRAIRRDALARLAPLLSSDHAGISELLARARDLGLRYTEVGVNHHPRAGAVRPSAGARTPSRRPRTARSPCLAWRSSG